MSAPLIPGLRLPPSKLWVRRGRSAGCLRFAPPPTRLVLSTPGPRPFGRPLPRDRSRSALVLSQHLGGLLQRQGCAHIAARYRQGFTAPPLGLPAWQARPEPPRAHSATPTKSNSPAVSIEAPVPPDAVPGPRKRGLEHHEVAGGASSVAGCGNRSESPLSPSAQPRRPDARRPLTRTATTLSTSSKSSRRNTLRREAAACLDTRGAS
jgi:hypothetical protein